MTQADCPCDYVDAAGYPVAEEHCICDTECERCMEFRHVAPLPFVDGSLMSLCATCTSAAVIAGEVAHDD